MHLILPLPQQIPVSIEQYFLLFQMIYEYDKILFGFPVTVVIFVSQQYTCLPITMIETLYTWYRLPYTRKGTLCDVSKLFVWERFLQHINIYGSYDTESIG